LELQGPFRTFHFPYSEADNNRPLVIPVIWRKSRGDFHKPGALYQVAREFLEKSEIRNTKIEIRGRKKRVE
jgi:hypothetical protein